NAAPQMAAVGHVAVLALDALTREPARLPLGVGVLEELAVQREALGRELVATLAELGAQERGSAGHAVVRERLAWRGRGERPVAARRAEPLVGTDVTARAHEPTGAEGGVVHRVRASSRAVGDARRLLGEGRVAGGAAQRRPGMAREHLDEAAWDP